MAIRLAQENGLFLMLEDGTRFKAEGPLPTQGLWKGVGFITDSTITADVDLLNVSWYYDWASYSTPVPEVIVPGYQYVPMMWGDWENDLRWGAGALGGDPASSIGDSDILLGFNEPDIDAQADMTVARALALWPQLEATGARLGSPAVTADGLAWLNSFMTGNGGPDPRVDFICAHWYPEYSGGYDLDDYLDLIYTTYGLPIWLTEVGDLDGGVSANNAMIPTVMTILETRPFVERIAWYIGREASGWPNTGLITSGGSLTAAGTTYAAIDPIVMPPEEPGETVPEAPSGLIAMSSNAQAILTWTAPADGGSPITDYVVQWRTTSGPGSWNTFSDGTSTTTGTTVTGLTNGTSYDFQVAAVNAIGTGPYSSIQSATPALPAAVPILRSATFLGTFGAKNAVKPPGLAVGDLLLGLEYGWSGFYFGTEDDSGDSSQDRLGPPLGDGWVSHEEFVWGNTPAAGIYYKIADADDVAATTFAFRSDSNALVVLCAVQVGTYNTSNPIGGFSLQRLNPSAASITAPAFTPAVNNCLGIFAALVDTGNGHSVAGYTERLDVNGSGFASGIVATAELTTASTGTVTATLSGAPGADQGGCFLVAIRPA